MAMTPGEMLREAREADELSLEQVAERTKIPARLLAALERDEYHKVSGPLYVKSFLRNYAQCVGLPPEHIVKLYEQATGTAAPASDSPEDQVWRDEDEVTVTKVGVDYGGLVLRIAAGIVALALLGALVWRLFFSGGGEPAAVPATAPETWEDWTTDTTAVAVPGSVPTLTDSMAAAVDTTVTGGMDRLDADSLAVGGDRRPGAR